jgi:hypothetical protein
METDAGIDGSKEPSFPSTFRQTADLGKLYGATDRGLSHSDLRPPSLLGLCRRSRVRWLFCSLFLRN